MSKTVFRLILIAIMLAAFIFLALFLSGCNRQVIDLKYNFNYAIVNTFDGTMEGKVSSWLDFENSDMIQVTIDSVTYLTHSSNVILEHK